MAAAARNPSSASPGDSHGNEEDDQGSSDANGSKKRQVITIGSNDAGEGHQSGGEQEAQLLEGHVLQVQVLQSAAARHGKRVKYQEEIQIFGALPGDQSPDQRGLASRNLSGLYFGAAADRTLIDDDMEEGSSADLRGKG